VPFLRPAALAADDTPDLPVFEHALAWLADEQGYVPDGVVHLRPTLPFRTSAQIDAVVALLAEHQVDGERLVPYLDTPFRRAVGPDYPRQKLEPVYWSAGLVDGIRRATITALRSTTGERVLPYLVDPDPCVDLDTPHDFLVAEAVLAYARQEDLAWAR
jgi:N-acylneuraminate cytidylyltransferase